MRKSTYWQRFKSVEERFWEKVDRRAPDECWPWKGAPLASGHGMFAWPKRGTFGAHKAMLLMIGTEIPKRAFVCHRCNNPICVNPAHLYVGDAKTNARDSIDAGTFNFVRPPTGERHWNAKLTDKQADEIRRLSLSTRKTARIYGVSPSLVSKVRRGERRGGVSSQPTA